MSDRNVPAHVRSRYGVPVRQASADVGYAKKGGVMDSLLGKTADQIYDAGLYEWGWIDFSDLGSPAELLWGAARYLIKQARGAFELQHVSGDGYTLWVSWKQFSSGGYEKIEILVSPKRAQDQLRIAYGPRAALIED